MAAAVEPAAHQTTLTSVRATGSTNAWQMAMCA